MSDPSTSPTDTHTETVRDRLVQAAARAMVSDEALLRHSRALVGAVFDALAPLIAEEIEAANQALFVVADLVRSWAAEQR